MNASKTLIAAIAAATIVGTVGFVSAQTAASNAPAAQGMEPMPNAMSGSQNLQQTAPVTAPADMSSPAYVAPDTSAPGKSTSTDSASPSTSTSTDTGTSGSSPSSVSSEPAPKADRN